MYRLQEQSEAHFIDDLSNLLLEIKNINVILNDNINKDLLKHAKKVNNFSNFLINRCCASVLNETRVEREPRVSEHSSTQKNHV